MKSRIVFVGVLLLASACAPIQTGPEFETLHPAATATVPFSSTRPPAVAQMTLWKFMQARLDRDESLVLDLLTDALEKDLLNRAAPVQPPLFQLSNPCWYRFETLLFIETEPPVAHARIRMFEHFWSGDSGGGVPRSWEQDITLTETTAGWRVSGLGNLENERAEPNEPHGETISACVVVRTTTP